MLALINWQMDSSSSSNTFTIIVSLTALFISILGYLDNRKNLKLNEKNLNIVLKGESNKKNLEQCWSILLETSKDLKELEKQSFIFGIDEAASNITMHVLEKEEIFNLSIRYTCLRIVNNENPEPNPLEIEINSIKNSKDFRTKAFSYKCEDSEIVFNPSCTVQFTADPAIIIIDEYDLSEIFSGLAHIENDLNNLKNFEPLIRTFDSGFLEVVDKNCQDIFDLLYEALNKKVYNFSFNNNVKRIKPSEITDMFYDSINYYEIMQKMEYMSEELKDRSEELGKTLVNKF
ncbi:hypothetical protein MSLAZ_0796 [Methanosarcina lacustris Z-7289]|uniref:Uncharacterized protein n=1 Tax=Methanosarcina lacustris Z-7289 TaxID=1434111 RepID=A0A0E3S4F9_9EURY|nr:hypothetical protein [Methanosarcina lacustris]AKB74057.1 hypothetical protein MSLAZ_0796 [Methanosarcina lacustris Z-7289]